MSRSETPGTSVIGTSYVVSGVVPRGVSGLAGVRELIDRSLAGPYLLLLVTVIGLIALAGLTGAQEPSDTIVFIAFVLAGGAVVIVLPALVRRLGEQPEPRHRPSRDPLDVVSLGISTERLILARSRMSGMDVDDRLRTRLREDLGIVLAARHGLDIDDSDDTDAIVAIVGADTWEIMRLDREPRPAWAALRRDDTQRLLERCLAAIDAPAQR